MTRSWLLLPLILLIHLVLLTNTRFTLWPEMVVYPYLLNNGFQLYQDIINPYFPAFIFVLSKVERIFGSNPLAYQIFTWTTIAVVDILIFKISQKLTGKISHAAASTAFFALFSIPFLVNGLWFDLVQTPFILLSVYFFHKHLKNPKSKNSILYSSIFVTIAFFIKQQALWLIIWYLVVLIFQFRLKSINIIKKNSKIFVIPIFIFILHVIFFTSQNLLKDFLYWTFYFPFFKASQLPGYLLLPSSRQILMLGILFAMFIPLLLSGKNNLKFFVITAIALVPFAYPRFDYFHTIPLLAVLSLVFTQNLEIAKKNRISKVLFTISLVILCAFTARYLERNWTKEVRFFESEIQKTSEKLKTLSSPKDIIYVQNGPDQVLALSGRLPPKPWADEFPWYLEMARLDQRIKTAMLDQKPTYVLFKPYEPGPKYQIGAYRSEEIATYIDQNYTNYLQISPTLWLKIKK